MAVKSEVRTRKNRRFFPWVLVLLIPVFGCGPDQTGRNNDGLGEVPAIMGDQAVVKINGSLITMMDIEREAALQKIIQPGDPVSPGSKDFERIVNELIDQRLLAQEAMKRKLDQDPEAQVRLQIARERILGNILVERAVADAVTDKAVRRLYQEQAGLADPGIEITARHILVETEEDADEIIRQLRAGAEFSTLAFERSIDANTRLEGGDLGYFIQNSLVEPLADAAFSLKDKEVSKPVKTRYGWHILQVMGRRAAQAPDLEELRPRIVRFMTFDEIQKLITDLRDNAAIERLIKAAPQAAKQQPAGLRPDE